MLKRIVSLGVFVLMFLTLVACNQTCNPDDDIGLSAGFANNEDESSLIWCAFTSEKSRLRVGEDLTIKLFYGRNGRGYDQYDPPPVSVTAKVYMLHYVYGHIDPYGGSYASELAEEVVLKEIDNFATPEYCWQYSPEKGWFAATETVIVPASWFVGERGAIMWSVSVSITFSESYFNGSEGGAVELFYRIKGENIILYDSSYNFYNDKRKLAFNCGG